jgi:hypothetical protein
MKSKEENNQQDLFEHRIRLNKDLAWRGAQQRIWVNKGRSIKTEGNYQSKSSQQARKESFMPRSCFSTTSEKF